MGFTQERFEAAAKLENERASNRSEVIARFFRYTRPHKRGMIFAAVAMVMSGIGMSTAPYFIGIAIDDYILKSDWWGLAGILSILFLLYGIQYFGFRWQFYFVGNIGQEIMAQLRKEIFHKTQRLSLSYFDKNDAGDLMSRLVNDVDVLSQFLGQGVVQFLGGIVRMIILAIAMFTVDWRLALATLSVVPVMLLASIYLSRMARIAFRKSRESLGEVSTELEEGISGVKVAQAFNRAEANAERFADLNRRNRDANVGAVAISAAFAPVMEALNAVAITIVAGYGGYMAITGVISIGIIVSFIEYVRRFFFLSNRSPSFGSEAQSSLAGAERIFNLLDEPITLTNAVDAKPMPEIQGKVQFEDVHFAYDKDEPVLQGVSLEALPGETIAVVGATGAGKTTLINLLTRFYDVTTGQVLIDGIDVRSVEQDSLREQIGVVLQDNFLFSGTVADNIRYGKLEATQDEIEAAAQTVGAHGFITGLSDGYETELGERGGTLSQGQRQLLSFARTILADPRILILDEATASVDTRTEVIIQEALSKLLADRTSFVIAHRLSTIRDADEVLVMEQGKIVERGTHSELVAQDGAYAQLHARQFREVASVE